MLRKSLRDDRGWVCGIPVSVGHCPLTFRNFAAPVFKKERNLA